MSAQSLLGYIVVIGFAAVTWGVSGYITGNIMLGWGNGFVNTWHLAQDSYNTAYLLVQIIVASPIFGLLLWGYDHINNSNSQQESDY
jgi:hypothetical protein